MIRINLLAAEPSTPRRGRTLLHGACVVAVCLPLTGYGSCLHRQRASLQAHATATDARLAESATVAARVDATRKRRATLASERDAIYRVLNDRRTSADLFEAISRSLTDALWLTEMKRSALNIQIDGLASSFGAVADMVLNLANGQSFARPPEIRSVAAEGADAPQRFRFQIVAELAAPLEARP